MIKKIFGIAPTKEKNRWLGRKFGVDKVSTIRLWWKKIHLMVLCTEERYFKMTNGKQFSTGNNVQETMVPLMQ
jgi:molecular chaperone Hsp31 and glyoxalase 3